MEDIRRRLEFGNTSIQRQAVYKLYDLAVKNCSKKCDVVSTSTEVPELRLLIEKCGAQEIVVSKTCSSAVVDLVLTGRRNMDYVMNAFINEVPCAKNLSGIITGIADLLALQASVAVQNKLEYVCPYTLRSPPHPFITLLTNRPGAWQLLCQQVASLFRHENTSVSHLAVVLLEPFLKFVLAEPQQNVQYQPMRMSLQRELLSVVRTSKDDIVRKDIVRFIINIIPCLQINDRSSLGLVAMFTVDCMDSCSQMMTEEQRCDLLTFMIDLTGEFVEKGLDITMLTSAINRSVELSQIAVTDDNIISLGVLLMTADFDATEELLKIVKTVLTTSRGKLNKIAPATLILPIIQILSLPHNTIKGQRTKKCMAASGEVLRMIECIINDSNANTDQIVDIVFRSHLTSASYVNQNYAFLVHKILTTDLFAEEWIKNLLSTLPKQKFIPHQLTNMVAALYILSKHPDRKMKALSVLNTIAEVDSSQALSFLPLYLYQLGKEENPQQRLVILKAIPSLAKHKFCVAAVLRTIQTFGYAPRLKAIAVDLMTDLWKLQDRCFPYLLKAISEPTASVYSGDEPDEMMLAKTKAIRDVCEHRPEQHGNDMLGPLSDILDCATSESNAPVASLALDGLYYLCKAEVIDIRSTWSVLGEKLGKDTRSAVKEKICLLFSLVPDLEVKTEEFQQFHEYVVSSLWLLVKCEENNVSGAALEALSKFDPSSFRISHLPETLTEDLIKHAKAMIQKEDNPELTVDDIYKSVPGSCFSKLLFELRPSALKSYQTYLRDVVGREVADLPRGIYHTSLRRQGTVKHQSKLISNLPTFIQQQYDKCKQPGVRPGLAAGLLFGYDPPVEVGRDGRPRKHYLITHSKQFQHMFSTLLNEVVLQPSEWHKTMLMPQAWTSFVDRMFTSVVEGRKAELDLQVKKDHISQEEAKDKQNTAWLWARDKITDVIKSASKGNPSVQGNAVLSLAGLAVAVNRYSSSLDQESLSCLEDNKEYQSTSHWSTVVIDTIMSLMDITFKPKGGILGMCQQRSVEDRLPASILAQASSVLALSQLVPVIITLDVNRVFMILDFISDRLPGQNNAHEAPALQFSYGLGMGMLLSRLFEEHFTDVCGSKGMIDIWKVLDLYEACCFSENCNSSGCLFGLGLAITAMSEEGKTESRAHVSSVYDKLVSFEGHIDKESSTYQATSMSLACMTGAGFSANILQVPKVNTALETLLTAQMQYPESLGISLAAGMLCFSLSKMGHHQVREPINNLQKRWTSVLQSKESSPMEQVAALNGLIALIGSERTLIPVQESMSFYVGAVDTEGIIKMTSQIVSSSDDIGIQNNAAWMLGHLYLSSCAVSESRSSVPLNYGYLPDHSILRAMVDFLIDAGKKGPEAVSDERVIVCLSSLQDRVKQALPPLNWAGILAPLMRNNFSDDVKESCLRLAINQGASSTTAAMFLTSWITAPLFGTLSKKNRGVLYANLSLLITFTSPAVLGSFMDNAVQEKDDVELNVLFGLGQALKVPDPPEAVTDILHRYLAVFYAKFINESEVERLHLLGECLGSVPDKIFDQLTEEDFQEDEHHYKHCFVRCYLVAQGRQPIALLNRCVDACFNNVTCNRQILISLLQQTFWQVSQCKSESTGVLLQIQWVLELLGHIRNLLTGVIPLSEKVRNVKEVGEFGFNIASAALCLWTSGSTTAIYNVKSDFLTNKFPVKSISQISDIACTTSMQPLALLPAYITGLECQPWDHVVSKVLDWISFMKQQVENNLIAYLTASEMCLRHSQDFRKAAVWTKAL